MNFLKKSLLVIFHPLDCFDIIKRECRQKKSDSVLLTLFLYFLAFLVNYLYVFIVHFPLSTKEIEDTSILLEAAMVVVPLFSWVVCSYAMTAIMSGESTFKENFTASGYCLVPYIILTPLLGVLSNLFGLGEAGVYSFFKNVSLLWVLLLLFICLKYLNDYTLRKTFGVAILSIIAIVIVWAVCLLFFSLTIQFVYFFIGIFEEINFKYLI